ncbi:hypothetical protein BH09PSE6_BH09PSE6_32510 [soil metagenome]
MSFILPSSRLALRISRPGLRPALAAVLIAAALTGCGQKGPLAMPVPPKPPGSARPAPTPVDPATAPPASSTEVPSPGGGQSSFTPSSDKR